MKHAPLIPRLVVPSVARVDLSPVKVKREFLKLVDDSRIDIAGTAKRQPSKLFDLKLFPKHRIDLFDTRFYLTNVVQKPELRFFVGYVVQESAKAKTVIYPRIIYKDLSLAWRSASHFTYINGHIWVGKGDVRIDEHDGFETIESIEATTDMPLEMQTALESLLQWSKRPLDGQGILDLVLKKAPIDRVEPYADFTRPRESAQSNRKNLINSNRSIARFTRRNDPHSLKIAKGFEPDFSNGIVERGKSHSKLYGGALRRYRILSVNRQVQYYFLSGKTHTWIVPAQATTTELSSYGVRTIDVVADDDLFIPGYEYHHYEETDSGRELYSQIPEGFVGAVCPFDEDKADASPWLNELSLVKQFRREVLKK